ncbi:MAG: cell envelope integrity protein TolA [Burkholderiaceae bacterium]|nr:cell envelope integrity protein TolA [Burkholderiaceae bacterium]
MTSSAVPYYVPQEPGRWRAIALAVFVHALLFTFLWVGIRWQSDTPQTIEAEVWSPQPQEVAPPPPPPPEPTPEVKQPEPQPEVKEPPVVKPDIALELDKKKKKLEEEKKAKELAEKKQAEKQAEKDKKLAEEKKRKQDEISKKLADQQRKAELKRIAGEVTATGTSGTAVRASGSKDAGWAGRVAAKIKSNTHFLVTSDANDPVEYDVRLLPDGSVAGMRKTKPSGNPTFDDAVAAAINLSQPFPADSSGRVPQQVLISQRPREQ